MNRFPPGTKVSCPTAPWRYRLPSERPGKRPEVLHAVAMIVGDGFPVALCRVDTLLTLTPPTRDEAAAGRRCEGCVDRLRWNDLWPLDC